MGWLRAVLVAAVLVPASASSLTLEEATSRALSANPRLQAARLAALAAQERAREAAGRAFGEVNLVGSYNSYESDRLVRPISVDLFKDPKLGFYQLPWDRNQVHYGIAYEIPLLAGGSLHEGRLIATLSQQASENLALFGEAELRYTVRATFRNALTLTHVLIAVTAYEQALETDASDADLKVKLGSWASVDAAKAHFAFENAQAQRQSIETQLAGVASTSVGTPGMPMLAHERTIGAKLRSFTWAKAKNLSAHQLLGPGHLRPGLRPRQLAALPAAARHHPVHPRRPTRLARRVRSPAGRSRPLRALHAPRTQPLRPGPRQPRAL